jgi:hypothetical protein
MNEMYQGEDFWIGLVEESIGLDWSEAFVPRTSLPMDVAMALAERLGLAVDVDASEYVFYQLDMRKTLVPENRVLH